MSCEAFMNIQGYECNQCKTSFEDLQSKPEVKCPQCGSSDIRQSDAASELLELLQEMGSTGG